MMAPELNTGVPKELSHRQGQSGKVSVPRTLPLPFLAHCNEYFEDLLDFGRVNGTFDRNIKNPIQYPRFLDLIMNGKSLRLFEGCKPARELLSFCDQHDDLFINFQNLPS